MKSCKSCICGAEISNLCSESVVYLEKMQPRINMRTLADYALNYVIA